MIVVASNDNESSQVTLPGFSILHVFSQWLRSLRLKTTWSSLTVWHFFIKRAKEANIFATRISLHVGFRELKIKRLVKLKLKEKIW